jgi:hypothetical protein
MGIKTTDCCEPGTNHFLTVCLNEMAENEGRAPQPALTPKTKPHNTFPENPGPHNR